MTYIYKLIDENTKHELQNHHRISLSRPFVEFKSERLGLSPFGEIIEIVENTPNIYSISPTQRCLHKIKQWIDKYYESLPMDVRNCYSYEYDLDDDLWIAMTIYFQTYCGYFTDVNFDDKSSLEHYLKQNNTLSRNKCSYIKIPVESNKLFDSFWITDNTDFVFKYDEHQDDNLFIDESIKGRLCIESAEYANSSDLKNPFINFNGKDNRRITSLLTYLKDQYKYQKEIRLMFRIPSNKAKESITAFSNLFNNKIFNSAEERIFYILASVYIKANEYPKYIYLQIDDYECKDIE